MYTVYIYTVIAVGGDKSRKEDTAAATQRIRLLYKSTAATHETALIREKTLGEDRSAATQRTALSKYLEQHVCHISSATPVGRLHRIRKLCSALCN